MPDLAVRDRRWDEARIGVRMTYAAGVRAAGMLMLLGIAGMLGACSKCDVPTPWEHGSLGSAPAACHAAPQPD
jgi:hypothetical protein